MKMTNFDKDMIPIVHKFKLESSLSDFEEYRNVMTNAANSDAAFDTFKTDKIYNMVLEHVSYSDGLKYSDVIQSHYPWLFKHFDKFKTNDSVGGATTHEYEWCGRISPSTLRYIKVLGDLVENFGTLNDMHIVEIGGGYGGQCKIIMDIFDVKTYTIIDLPEANMLQKKYVEKLVADSSKIKVVNGHDEFLFDEIPSFNLCISNYALTECKGHIREKYIDRVMKYSARGYITVNYLTNDARDYFHKQIEKYHNIRICDENPLTHLQNYCLLWGK